MQKDVPVRNSQSLALAAAFLFLGLISCGPATTHPAPTPSAPPPLATAVPAPDPGAFAENFAMRVGREGTLPYRELLQQMQPTAIAQNEMVLNTLDSGIRGREALLSRKLDDVIIADSFRRVYYLHAFEGAVVFTRLDFVNFGPRGWHVSAVFFGSTWENVAAGLTPGFQPTPETSAP